MTPDKVETRIGTLEFFDGLPSDETVEKVYDNLDFMRGVEAFLNFIPATSIEGIRRGMVKMGATRSNQVTIMNRLMDSNPATRTRYTLRWAWIWTAMDRPWWRSHREAARAPSTMRSFASS